MEQISINGEDLYLQDVCFYDVNPTCDLHVSFTFQFKSEWGLIWIPRFYLSFKSVESFANFNIFWLNIQYSRR